MKQNEHTENDWALCNQDHKIPRPRTGTRRDYLSEAEQDPEWAILKKIYPKENFSPRVARSWLYRRNHRQGLILDGDLELVYRRFRLADIPAEAEVRYDCDDRPIPPRPVLPPTLEEFLDMTTLRQLIQAATDWDTDASTQWVESKLQEELHGRYFLDDKGRVESLNNQETMRRIWKVEGDFWRGWREGRIDPFEVLAQGIEAWDKLNRRCLLAYGMREAGEDEGVLFFDLSREERDGAVNDLVACPYLYEHFSIGLNAEFIATYYGLTREVYRELRRAYEQTYDDLVEAKRVRLLGERTRPALNEIPEGEAL